MPAVSAEEAPRLRPYLTLAQQLGSFAGQLTHSGLKAVTIEYEGHAAELNTRPLTAVALAGLLTPLLDNVNMVNAPLIARERNIEVSEVKHSRPGSFQTLIRLSVTTERQSRAVAGTLFGGGKPRLVEVKGIAIEAELSPHMLYITNRDKPGFIGRLGTLLGDAEDQYRHLPPRPQRAGRRCDLPHRGGPCGERGAARPHSRDSGCGPGDGAVVLIFPLPPPGRSARAAGEVEMRGVDLPSGDQQ